jgi:DNA-binding MarR family transcriptional regulator
MGEVADLMGVDPSTSTRSVQRLIKDGLAERIEHAGDARVVMVGPTEFGREVYLHVVDRRRDVLRAVIEQFDDDERELVADILERFSAAVDRAVSTHVPQHR